MGCFSCAGQTLVEMSYDFGRGKDSEERESITVCFKV